MSLKIRKHYRDMTVQYAFLMLCARTPFCQASTNLPQSHIKTTYYCCLCTTKSVTERNCQVKVQIVFLGLVHALTIVCILFSAHSLMMHCIHRPLNNSHTKSDQNTNNIVASGLLSLAERNLFGKNQCMMHHI